MGINNQIQEFLKQLKEQTRDMIEEYKSIEIFQVTSINKETYSVNIKSLQLTTGYRDVPIIGTGLGNYKGILRIPNIGDLVLCAFLDKDTQPIILGSVFDRFTIKPDGIPQVNENELLIVNREFGGIILFKEDNSIIITTGNKQNNFYPKIKLDNINKNVVITVGDGTNEGAKFKLNPDGSWKVFNKDNYGIECTSSNRVIARDSTGTIQQTSTPGTF